MDQTDAREGSRPLKELGEHKTDAASISDRAIGDGAENSETTSSDSSKGKERTPGWLKRNVLKTTVADWVIALATFVMAVTSFLQWQVINDQLKEMKKGASDTQTLAQAAKAQADMLRSQIAAIVEFNVWFSNQHVAVSAVNRGRSIARNVGGKMTISRQSLPDQRQIGEPVTYDIIFADLGPAPIANEAANNGTNREYEIPGFTNRAMEAVMRTEEGVKVRATFHYDNGFGEVQQSERCVSLIWHSKPVNVIGGSMTANYTGFQECQQFPSILQTVLESKKQAADRKP